MSATPRPARLSSPGEVVAILVASAAVWVVLIAVVATLFFAVFVPAFAFSGRGEIPADFPVYPDAGLSSAFASRSLGCTTVDAAWSTPDGAPSVVSFYREQLAAGDWTVTGSTGTGSATVITFQGTSTPHREGRLTIEQQPGSRTTLISLTLVKSGPQSECHSLVGVVASRLKRRRAWSTLRSCRRCSWRRR